MDLNEFMAAVAVLAAVTLLVGTIIFFGLRSARKAKASGRDNPNWSPDLPDYHYTDHS